MENPDSLPLFPLGTPLFPGCGLPLRIFEPRYVAMAEACLRDDTPFGVVLIRAGYETGKPAVPWDVGCTARIVQHQSQAGRRYNLLCRGEQRFRINQRHAREDDLLVGQVTPLPAMPDVPLPAGHAELATLLQDVLKQVGHNFVGSDTACDNAATIAYQLAQFLPITPERKQKLLECDTLDALLKALSAQVSELRGEWGSRSGPPS